MKTSWSQHQASIPPTRNATQTWTQRNWLELRIADDKGRNGRGVVAPLPGVSPETLEDVELDLQRLRAYLAGQTDPEAALDAALKRAPVMHPSARFGVQCALIELIAYDRDEPAWITVARILGRSPDKSFRTAEWIVPGLPIDTYGATGCVKLKVGEDLDRERAHMQQLRNISSDIEIRIDANRSLDAETALSFAKSLAPLNIIFFEEPCPPEDLLTRPRLAIPIALDETLCEPRALSLFHELREVHTVAAFSLKPTRLGDLRNIAFWASLAQEHGITPIVSHCLEPAAAYPPLRALASVYPQACHGLGAHALHPTPSPDLWSESGWGVGAQ